MQRLHLPIAVSLALHAAIAAILFWGAYSLYEKETGGSGTGGVVSVWIAGPAGETIGAEAPASVPRRAAPRPSAVMHATAQAPQAAAAAASAGGAPAANATGTGGGEGVGTGQGAGVGSGSGGNPVLAKIWKRINSSKYYPETAKRQKMEGSPRVTFSIAEDGSVANVAIAASCGMAILDDAAKETVRRAAPLPFYPQPITLTVKYSLAN